MTDLKPCPFCGAEAYYSYNEMEESWRIRCFRCEATITRYFKGRISTEMDLKKARDVAIDAWNHRVKGEEE